MAEQALTCQRQIKTLRRTRDLLLPRLLSGSISFDDLPTEPDRIGAIAAQQTDVPSQTSARSRLKALKEDEEREVIATMAANKLKRATAKRSDGDEEAPPQIEDTERTDVLAVIRQVFSDGEPRERESAIRDIAYALGYGRTGHVIEEVLRSDLTTAVRRGILENVRGELKLRTRNIEDYDRDFLKEQFLAAIGRTWIEREEAIRDFARWLGFLRTGSLIDETARSVINGLLRETRLEADGPDVIRRV
jgi:hypothetical protein